MKSCTYWWYLHQNSGAGLHKLKSVRISNLSDNLKRQFSRAGEESVAVYRSNTWTLTKKLEQKLDGSYTRMLRTVLNISWKDHPTKQRLYGKLKSVSSSIKERRLRFAGHCYRSKKELVSNVILWQPKHGKTSVGRPRKTYYQQIAEDANCEVEDLHTLMSNRDEWRERVQMIRAISPSG